MNGLVREEVKGKWLEDVTPANLVEEILIRYRTAIRTHTPVSWISIASFPTGLKTDEITVTPLYDTSGDCHHLVGVVNDLTEIRKREADTRLQSEFFDRMANQMFDLVTSFDLDGRFTYVSPNVTKILGDTPEELMGTYMKELIVEDEQPTSTGNLEKVLKGMQISRVKRRVRKADSSVVTFEFNSIPIYEGEKVVGIQTVGRDVSETIRLQALQVRAERLAASAQIAGQVAHDFNNLLTPLCAYPELVRAELSVEHPALEILASMEQCAQRMAKMNQQLLTLSRRGHYQIEVLDLNSIIRAVVTESRRAQSSLIPHLDLVSDLFYVRGGSDQLHRVFLNLKLNARDAAGETGMVAIKTENVYLDCDFNGYCSIPSGEYVRVSISDNGPGIPPDILEHIFDPYFTTKRGTDKQGSGLGLSICDAVIKDHGGYIDVETKINQGTTFAVYLPITRDPLEGKPSLKVNGGTESILVVDDDALQREVSSRLLSGFGYRVTTSKSGEEALEVLSTQNFDLCIFDIVMPGGIDGTETLRRAKALRASQRAILVSGYAEGAKVREALGLGSGTFVRKPYTLFILGRAVREELDK